MNPPDFVPVLLVAVPLAGTGLIALTRTHTRVDRAEQDIAQKADKTAVETAVGGLDKRLDRMEGKLDRLVERDLPR